jgi:TolB-like protein
MLDELTRILASDHFGKARRLSSLLNYLVAQAQQGAARLTSEYAIGMEVFGRDAASYSTGDDPIVRVQMGRLRHKLDDYYAGPGNANPFCISIPLGGYMPRCTANLARTAQGARLGFAPVSCIGDDVLASRFAAGLNEELCYRLYQRLGLRLAARPQSCPAAAPAWHRAVSHVLEGSVRVEASAMRTSFRLLEIETGNIVWSRRVDHADDVSVARQEALAELCCSAVDASAFMG